MLTYEQVNRRLSAAKSLKRLREQDIRDAYNYTLPERNTFDKVVPGNNKRSVKLNTSIGKKALKGFADRLTSTLVPPGTQWMKLEAGTDVDDKESDAVNKYLEDTTKILFTHLDYSNFTTQINESFFDLGISTGAIIVRESDGIQSSLTFQAVPLTELFIERSTDGTINTVWREFRLTVREIKSTWKNAKMTESLLQLERDKPETEVTLVEGYVEDGKSNRMQLMYGKDKVFLIDDEIDFNPFVVFREWTIPGDTYGYGRAMSAIEDLKSLNAIKRDYYKSLNWVANPIFKANDDGIINPSTVVVKPGAVIGVGSMDSLDVLNTGGRPDLLEFEVRSLENSINEVFISKSFGNIEETPVRTATEMSIRNAEMAQNSLAASTRIQSELLEKITANCVKILKKAGKIADFKVDGKEVAIKFVNPATRQQDESILAGYSRYGQMMLEMQMPQDLQAQKIKIEDLPSMIWEKLGLPKSGQRNDEEIQGIQEQQAQQAQQQQMAAQGGQA